MVRVFDNIILIEDDQISICAGVRYDKELIFEEDGSYQIVYKTGNDTSFTYHILENKHVEIIENRNFNNHTNRRHIIVDRDANVSIYIDDTSTGNNTVIDTGDIYENAVVKIGYAQLNTTDTSTTLDYHLKGEGAYLSLRTAIYSKNKKNYEVSITHDARYSTGIMDNYGVVAQGGELTIDGIGRINKGYNGSSSHQTNKIMVFDENCKASANPYLFIDEYDVSASHAAGVGKMDEEHLYYLESRGLSRNDAMSLITYGYLLPVAHVIENEVILKDFEEKLMKAGVIDD